MRVFKFGGASVKNAEAIRNVAKIIQSYQGEKLLVVISAMGKTTNFLEEILNQRFHDLQYEEKLGDLKYYHQSIINELFDNKTEHATGKVQDLFTSIENKLNSSSLPEYGAFYDSIVSYGEYLSTAIISEYLTTIGLRNKPIDATSYILTDEIFQEGSVKWDETCELIGQLKNLLEDDLLITQGFIGATQNNDITTLGREGSDFTAAIFASCLNADSVTIWKDVPGILNGDPKVIKEVVLFKELPYNEASEMTYYGASVIHPKTIKPLANKNIPLLVRNFDNPQEEGTIIHECKVDYLPPSVILKENQCLFSFKVTDFTFVDEDGISKIFKLLHHLNIQINIMQNSAISFSVCFDFNERKVEELKKMINDNFKYFYNTGLTLITLKNYDQSTLKKYTVRRNILLEQKSRKNYRFLCSDSLEFDAF